MAINSRDTGTAGIMTKIRNAMSSVLKAERISTSVTANTDIFSSDIEIDSNGFLIFQFITNTAGYPIIKNKTYGSGEHQSAGLNESSNLTVDSWYEFWLTVRSGDVINVQFSVDALLIVRVFFVEAS